MLIIDLETLFGKSKTRILSLLFNERELHTREIIRRVGTGHGAVQRQLSILTESNILLKRDGVQVYYQANTRSPVYPELLSIFKQKN